MNFAFDQRVFHRDRRSFVVRSLTILFSTSVQQRSRFRSNSQLIAVYFFIHLRQPTLNTGAVNSNDAHHQHRWRKAEGIELLDVLSLNEHKAFSLKWLIKDRIMRGTIGRLPKRHLSQLIISEVKRININILCTWWRFLLYWNLIFYWITFYNRYYNLNGIKNMINQ